MSDDVKTVSGKDDYCLGVPPERRQRDELRAAAGDYVVNNALVAPVSLEDLNCHAETMLLEEQLSADYQPFAIVVLNNELWRQSLLAVPFEKRLLLLPQCLKHSQSCPAEIDHLGLICKHCGRCTIDRISHRAEELGYAVLIVEGSPVVMAMIESGQIQATVGVSCLSVLERVFPYMEAAAVPGMAIPLLKDGCVDTIFDEDWLTDVLEVFEETREAVDLTRLKKIVADWFEPEKLATYFPEADGQTGQLAADWLAGAGKRYRPLLAAGVYATLTATAIDKISESVRQSAVAIECFHKASLVHDDIEDGDTHRYNQPTLHETHGVPIALNAGDYLIGQGYQLLAELGCDNTQKTELLKIAAEGHRRLCIGQGAELAATAGKEDLPVEKVLAIFSQKTSPAFAVALKIGAVLANADESILTALDAYSEAVGIAYQIRDDLLDWQAAQSHKELSIIESLARDMETDKAIAETRRLLEVYRKQAIASLDGIVQSDCKAFLRKVITKIFDGTEAMGCCDEHSSESD